MRVTLENIGRLSTVQRLGLYRVEHLSIFVDFALNEKIMDPAVNFGFSLDFFWDSLLFQSLLQ
jgi:hypothetical protein